MGKKEDVLNCIVNLLDKLVDSTAFWSFATLIVSTLLVPFVTYFITNSMNHRKTILSAKMYKYEKMLSVYLDAMKNTRQLIINNNLNIITIISLYSEVYIIGSDGTKKLIDDLCRLITEYASNNSQDTFNKIQVKCGEIEGSLRKDLKHIEKTVESEINSV